MEAVAAAVAAAPLRLHAHGAQAAARRPDGVQHLRGAAGPRQARVAARALPRAAPHREGDAAAGEAALRGGLLGALQALPRTRDGPLAAPGAVAADRVDPRVAVGADASAAEADVRVRGPTLHGAGAQGAPGAGAKAAAEAGLLLGGLAGRAELPTPGVAPHARPEAGRAPLAPAAAVVATRAGHAEAAPPRGPGRVAVGALQLHDLGGQALGAPPGTAEAAAAAAADAPDDPDTPACQASAAVEADQVAGDAGRQDEAAPARGPAQLGGAGAVVPPTRLPAARAGAARADHLTVG